MSRVRERRTRDVFALPLLLFVVGCAGLLSALLGNGAWDGFSWLLLASPLGLVVVCLVRARRGG